MDLTSAQWRKSSHSGAQGGDCVEVAGVGGGIALRDSKDPGGPALMLDRGSWRRFTAQIKRDRLRP